MSHDEALSARGLFRASVQGNVPLAETGNVNGHRGISLITTDELAFPAPDVGGGPASFIAPRDSRTGHHSVRTRIHSVSIYRHALC